MDLTSFARILGGAKRLEGSDASRPTNVSRIFGIAMSNSSDGKVLVNLDSQVFSGDGSQYVELPTSVNVRKGDIVYVDMVGADGKGKSLMITGAAGSGDRQQGEINSAAHAASVAWDWADDAHDAATTAWEWADDAHDAAAAAQGSADAAQSSADAAQSSADAAATSASAANASATRANTAANSALTQLSVVEDVAGTLQWISDHGAFARTTDTTVHEGTVYFAYEGGDYVPIAEPTGNPAAMGWYVLDVSQSQSDYIMSHLAVTSRGLWVLPNGFGTATDAQRAPGYKLLLASTGSYLYDGSGAEVMSYGESITMASSRPQYIGGENAYIIYYDTNDDGVPDTISIGGKVLVGGSRTLSETLSDLATASSDAAKSATSYITEISGDGIWITPSNAKPVNGAAASTTSGWHISSALELFRLGVSMFRVFVESGVAKVRIGRTNGGNVLVDGTSVNVRNGSAVLATFASSLIELGKNSTSAVIKLCGGAGKITANDTDIYMSGANRLAWLGLWERSAVSVVTIGATASQSGTAGITLTSGAAAGVQAEVSADTFKATLDGCEGFMRPIGIYSASITTAANNYSNTTITFGSAMTMSDTNYSVILSTEGAPAGFTKAAYTVTSKTSTGFTIHCYNDYTASVTQTVNALVVHR